MSEKRIHWTALAPAPPADISEGHEITVDQACIRHLGQYMAHSNAYSAAIKAFCDAPESERPAHGPKIRHGSYVDYEAALSGWRVAALLKGHDWSWIQAVCADQQSAYEWAFDWLIGLGVDADVVGRLTIEDGDDVQFALVEAEVTA